MNEDHKEDTLGARRAGFHRLVYDRVSAWLIAIVANVLLMAAIASVLARRGGLAEACQLCIAGFLALIASILLENRARQA